VTTAGRRTQSERVTQSSHRLRTAFAELLIERGYERTTAADVGERAGYSRAMVRERFGSKEELLAALQGDFERLIFEPLELPEPQARSGLAQALAGFDSLALFTEHDPLVLRALFVVGMESVTTRHVFRDTWVGAVARVRSSFTAWLHQGRADGSVDPDLDIDEVVEEIVVAALGAGFLWAQDGDQAAYLARIHRYRTAFAQRCAAPS
jgi:AcrR family transcriptional regulator